MKNHQLFRFKPDDHLGKLAFIINHSQQDQTKMKLTKEQLSKVRDSNRTTDERLDYIESLRREKSSIILDHIDELDGQIRRYDIALSYIDDAESEKHVGFLRIELMLRRDNLKRAVKYGLNYLTPDQMSQLGKVKTGSDTSIIDRASLLGHLHLQRLTAEKDAN